MSLLDRHLAFLEALRGAGMPVSLSEDLDAVQALGLVGWGERSQVHDVYAATLVKRASQRPTFEELFELYFPRMVGSSPPNGQSLTTESGVPPEALAPEELQEALEQFRQELVDSLASENRQQNRQLATQAVGRFGSMPGRGPGMSSWSSYTALRRLDPGEIERRLTEALQQQGWPEGQAREAAGRRVREYQQMVEADARRRIAEEKGPDQIAKVTVRPTIEKLNFLHARKADVEELRRQLYPLARKLATRMAKQKHARRRGPLDIRRTMRESMSYGGVPLDTRHRPKRPHRNELVVLCDVSGSVSHFATFTLLLVIALREQFSKVRAFMFVDDIVEVTDAMQPGADLVDTMEELTKQANYAATVGRTNYGRAFKRFAEKYPDAVGPKSALLILGDARSNYADLHLDALRELADRARHSWWLNPEVEMQWDVGDSAATPYGRIVPMVECRNLEQLTEFVHHLA
ncbi:vWA domain-containing protein [Nocardioides sp. Kera G14]|uniref:vWA domain-containing protein n=1 Tax=Nocardioides sp. Kera G14 TaxID=2884264 RepID=UPI001D0F6FC8|nr:VWA domain-containing protein [Nocardioides sp. Kera G14]UDY23693.1 VWA domain-containing protein [Nocardioides sp. Kera G14]